MSMNTLRFYINAAVRIFIGIMAPAHEFWCAYLNADMSSFMWWCHVVFGVVALIVFILVLLEDILQRIFEYRPDIRGYRY